MELPLERNQNCDGACPRFEGLFDNLVARQSNLDDARAYNRRSRDTLGRTTEAINEADAGVRFRAIDSFLEDGIEPTEEMIDHIDSRVDRTGLAQAADIVNTQTASVEELDKKIAASQKVVDIRARALQACPGPNTSKVAHLLARVGLTDRRPDGCQFDIRLGFQDQQPT